MNKKNEKLIRINKYLALCGIASRRKSEKLVLEGKISVNGKIIKDLSIKINPDSDQVYYNGIIVEPEKYVYYKFYKPVGIVTTLSDEYNRKTIDLFFNDVETSIFPVGRLDMDSEGLLIVTNDGDLANKLSHPRFKLEKIYEVVINKKINKSEIEKLKNGVRLKEGITKECKVELISQNKKQSELLFVLTQGWNRQIRRMLEEISPGIKIIKLKRIFIGPIGIGNLKKGEKRKLSSNELKQLKKITKT